MDGYTVDQLTTPFFEANQGIQHWMQATNLGHWVLAGISAFCIIYMLAATYRAE